MKKITVRMVVVLAILFLSACAASKEKTALDLIKECSVAKLELPDGPVVYVDSEIAALRSFADLQLQESLLEPADSEQDWLYRIVFNPSEKVKNAEEIVVSFHKDYVQIGSEYYLPRDGVLYESILEWVESKFNCFYKQTN